MFFFVVACVLIDRRWRGAAACERSGVLLVVGLHRTVQHGPRLLRLPLRVSDDMMTPQTRLSLGAVRLSLNEML